MQADTTDIEKRTGSHFAGTAALVFALVYFLFPVVFVWPIFKVYGSKGSPRPIAKVMNMFLWPDNYLYQHVPFYRRMIDAEAHWVGLS